MAKAKNYPVIDLLALAAVSMHNGQPRRASSYLTQACAHSGFKAALATLINRNKPAVAGVDDDFDATIEDEPAFDEDDGDDELELSRLLQHAGADEDEDGLEADEDEDEDEEDEDYAGLDDEDEDECEDEEDEEEVEEASTRGRGRAKGRARRAVASTQRSLNTRAMRNLRALR